MPNNGYFDTVFANTGSTAVVPDAIQPDGSVSYQQGYGPNYTATPGTSGALDIEETKFNQILKDITTALQQYQQHGTPPFITTTMNGGSPYSYSKGDRVLFGGAPYESTSNANTSTPPGANWAPLDFSKGVAGSVRNLSAIATNTGHTMGFLADEIIVEDVLGGLTGKITNLNVSLDVNTNGANGMDVGSPPVGAGICVYAIKGPGMPDAVLGTIAGYGATVYGGSHMPAGYTQSALISIPPIMNGSGQFIGFIQYDREVFFNGLYLVYNNGTGSVGFTAQSVSTCVPGFAKSLSGNIQQTLSGATTGAALQCGAAADTLGTGAQYGTEISNNNPLGFYNTLNFVNVPIITNQTMYWKSNDARANSISIQIIGYKF